MTQNLDRFDQQARLLEARLHIEALRESELSQLPRTLESIRGQMWNAQTELPSVDISRLWLTVESRVTTGDQAGELRREATQQLRENARPVFSGVAAAGVLVSNAPGGELETPVDFAAESGGSAWVVATQQIEPDSLPGGFGFSLDSSSLNLDLEPDVTTAFGEPANLLPDSGGSAELAPLLDATGTLTPSAVPGAASSSAEPAPVGGDGGLDGSEPSVTPASDLGGDSGAEPTSSGPSLAAALGGATEVDGGSAAPCDLSGVLGDPIELDDGPVVAAGLSGEETTPPSDTTAAGTPSDGGIDTTNGGSDSTLTDGGTDSTPTDVVDTVESADGSSDAGGSVDAPAGSMDAGASADGPTDAGGSTDAGTSTDGSSDASGSTDAPTDSVDGGTGSDELATASVSHASAEGLENGQAGSAPSATVDGSGSPSGSSTNAGATIGDGGDGEGGEPRGRGLRRP